MIGNYLFVAGLVASVSLLLLIISTLNYKNSYNDTYDIMSKRQWAYAVKYTLFMLLASPVWFLAVPAVIIVFIFKFLRAAFDISINASKEIGR